MPCRFRARKFAEKSEDRQDFLCGHGAARVFRRPFELRARAGLVVRALFLPFKKEKNGLPFSRFRPFRLPLSPSLPSRHKGSALSCGAFFSPFFRANPRRDRTFPRSAYFLGIFLLFAFDFCAQFFLTCNLLLCKLQTRGRAEGSTVRGDRQKPVGPAEFSPRVPSTESRKRSVFSGLWDSVRRQGRGGVLVWQGEVEFRPPLPDPGESERSAPGGEVFPERRVSEHPAPGLRTL